MLENIPAKEPERQYYFIEKARELVQEEKGDAWASPFLSRDHVRLPDERQGFGEA